jgi:NADH dehydrogenase FAD-containing subunit
MAKTVVILGGSYAGLAVAHQLLQKTLPLVPELKVILVSTSSHLFWNVASPRAIIPKQLPDEQVFQPIEPAFAKYPSGSFEFIVGAAKNVEPTTNTVQVSTKEGEKALSYDALVVTTGAGAIGGAPWKLLGSYEETVAVLHETQEKVQKAQSIVVGGGGVTGVETAGELGYEYGTTKEITLVSR